MVAHVHGGVNRQQKETNPVDVSATQQVRVGTHDQGERFPMAELIIAPALKPAENRMEPFIRIFFQLPKYRDVARITDFFGQVGRIENVLGLEIGVCLGALEVTQINTQTEVLERLVDKAGVARLITRHETHQLLDVRVFNVLENLVVQNTTRELRGE